MSGTSFFSLMALAFIILKLCKVITWSWLAVLSPVWLVVVMWIVIIVSLEIWFKKENKARRHPNYGKSKWQIRMEEMREYQKQREGHV